MPSSHPPITIKKVNIASIASKNSTATNGTVRRTVVSQESTNPMIVRTSNKTDQEQESFIQKIIEEGMWAPQIPLKREKKSVPPILPPLPGYILNQSRLMDDSRAGEKAEGQVETEHAKHKVETTRPPFEAGKSRRTLRRAAGKTLSVYATKANSLSVSRALAPSISTLSAPETKILINLINALDSCKSKSELKIAINAVMQNENVGRLVLDILDSPDFKIFFRNGTSIKHSRSLSLPLASSFSTLPSTENNFNPIGNLVDQIIRSPFKGTLLARVLGNGRQELNIGNENSKAQNLAAEAGFESTQQDIYGATFGRKNIQRHREGNRLPTYELLTRLFAFSPAKAIADNGVEQVLEATAKHWEYMLKNPSGNFSHQRMELLDPFSAMRSMMPALLASLAALRGPNSTNATIIGPFVQKLEKLEKSNDLKELSNLIKELKTDVILAVTAGVETRSKPFMAWADQLEKSLGQLENAAEPVASILGRNRGAIKNGERIANSANKDLPSKDKIKSNLRNYLFKKASLDKAKELTKEQVIMERALDKLNPKDKRTLESLYSKNLDAPIKDKILKRATKLYYRELQREAIGKEIEKLEKESPGSKKAIVKAQLDAVTLELDHFKVFSPDAYMELTGLRKDMQDLFLLAQIQHESLDQEKIEVLKEAKQDTSHTIRDIRDLNIGQIYWINDDNGFEPIKYLGEVRNDIKFSDKNGKEFTIEISYESLLNAALEGTGDLEDLDIRDIPPQNLYIVGGGPSGLLTALQSVLNVLKTSGKVTLAEQRDASDQHASYAERAQIVRLDARWIAMLRYLTGTRFEDVFVPLRNEVSPHLSNTLPDEGFVELTIKQLEDVLQVALVQLQSSGLVSYHTDNKVEYDKDLDALVKKGSALKEGDLIVLKNEDKQAFGINEDSTNKWKVSKQGDTHIELVPDIGSTKDTGKKDTDKKDEVISVALAAIEKRNIIINTNDTNIVLATGKAKDERENFTISSKEHYGVCCISGLSVSNMHEMGNTRFGNTLQDDFRTAFFDDDNMRLTGDFTKAIYSQPVAEEMNTLLATNNWQSYLKNLIPGNNDDGQKDSIMAAISEKTQELLNNAPDFFRKSSQSRVFSTGDNFYLGMEVAPEFKQWRNDIVASLGISDKRKAAALSKGLDKLYFQAAVNTLLNADVFNPGAKAKFPQFRIIDSVNPQHLSLLKGNSPFLADVSTDGKITTVDKNTDTGTLTRFEIVHKPVRMLGRNPDVIARDAEGNIHTFPPNTQVIRANDLSRAPDGKRESKVSLATFDVAHQVGDKAFELRKDGKTIITFAGDKKASPHFMRYSGLTGAAISAMEVARFIGSSLESGDNFLERLQTFTDEERWQMDEVTIRGMGIAGQGKDAFLRPAFELPNVVKFAHSRMHEANMAQEEEVLIPALKRKIAAGLVPKGMEDDSEFIHALKKNLRDYIDSRIFSIFQIQLSNIGISVDRESFAPELLEGSDNYDTVIEKLLSNSTFINDEQKQTARNIVAYQLQNKDQLETLFDEVIERAKQEADTNKRSQISDIQSSPIDGIYLNDTQINQSFIPGITQTATIQVASLSSGSSSLGTVTGIASPFLSLGTYVDLSRAVRTNENHQVDYVDNAALEVECRVFALLGKDHRSANQGSDPFQKMLDSTVNKFEKLTYRYEAPPLECAGAIHELAGLSSEPEKLDRLIKHIQTELLPGTYQAFPYVKDKLVELLRQLQQIRYMPEPENSAAAEQKALETFQEVQEWLPQLEKQVERSEPALGTFKVRRLRNHQVPTIARNRFNAAVSAIAHNSKKAQQATLELKNNAILKSLEELQEELGNSALANQISDLKTLVNSTNEVARLKLLMASTATSGTVALALAIGNIARLASGDDFAALGVLSTHLQATIGPIAPLIAIGTIAQRQRDLEHLIGQAQEKLKSARSDEEKATLKQEISLARHNVRINSERMATNGLAIAAFVMGLTPAAPAVPIVAGSALASSAVSKADQLYLDLIKLYNLDQNFPQRLYEVYERDIKSIYDTLKEQASTTHTDRKIDEKALCERVTQAFIRQHRFDRIVSTPQFTSIVHSMNAELGKATALEGSEKSSS